jgi:small-conductance mechanosensitive channel
MAEEQTKSGGGKIGHLWVTIKKHPVISSIGLFVIGAILIYLYYKSGSSSTAATAANNGATSAALDSNYLAAQAQNNSLQANLEAQSQQVAAAANAATQQVNGAVSINTSNNQAAIDLASIASGAQAQIASLQAQLGTTQSNNALSGQNLITTTQGAVDQSQIAASTAQQQINANTTTTLSGQQTSVLTGLLNDIFAAPKGPTGVLPANFSQATSTNSRIASLIPEIQSQPASALFSQQQVLQLLGG